MNLKNNKAFTLVEVLVVIVVIGILSAITYTAVDSSVKKSQDAKIVHALDSLNKELLNYYNLSGSFQYPKGEFCIEDDTKNSVLVSALGMNNTPKHPEYDLDNKVCYFYTSNGDNYSILAKSPNGGYLIADSKTTKVGGVKTKCESGWIPFGNRCVMQYEAKNNGSDVAVSKASGTPWVNITQEEAKEACQSIGAHLITNAEWMALARDIEQVDSNWTGGSVGSGVLKRGNVGNTNAGNYNGADPEEGVTNDLAKLKLSNGEEIYHFSGNVWEWVNETKLTSELPNYSSAWREINSITYTDDLPYSMVGPINESYDSGDGIGKIYTDNNDAYPSGNVHAFLRGGYWNYAEYAGVFALTLYCSPLCEYSNIGFRCVR